jgi:hypothetical protein
MSVLPDLADIAWVKSSYSGNSGGECVEVAVAGGAVAVRDSKVPGGPRLTFPAAAFAHLVRSVSVDR